MADSGDRFAGWMTRLPERLQSVPLNQIAIPGSHDSFSFFLDTNSTVAPGSPDTIRNLVSFFGKAAKKIVWNWSCTQTLNFEQQLDLGIRYFDFRISTRKEKDAQFYFVHGLYGEMVDMGLKVIKEWLSTHPTEVVLLDFNHLYAMDVRDHTKLIQLICSIFGERLCPKHDIQKLTLKFMWKMKYQVLSFYHNGNVSGYNGLWPGSSIPSIWPNTPEAPKMVNRLEAHYTRGRPKGTFCVFQGVLTPTGTTILQHIHRTLKEALAPQATKNILHFIKDKPTGETGINIVIADFIEEHEFVQKVLELNK